ncbi:hypothetical protein KUDE01_003252, partial [Dissostichus eleginoides]
WKVSRSVKEESFVSLMWVRIWSRDQCKTLVKLKPRLPVQNKTTPRPPPPPPVQL